MANSYWILNKDYHRETVAKKGWNPGRNLGKSSKTSENQDILKKQNNLLSPDTDGRPYLTIHIPAKVSK